MTRKRTRQVEPGKPFVRGDYNNPDFERDPANARRQHFRLEWNRHIDEIESRVEVLEAIVRKHRNLLHPERQEKYIKRAELLRQIVRNARIRLGG